MGLWMPWPASAWPAPPPQQSHKPPKKPPLLPRAQGRHHQPKIHCQRSFLGLVEWRRPPEFRLPLPALRRPHATPVWPWGWQESEGCPSAACGQVERRPLHRNEGDSFQMAIRAIRFWQYGGSSSDYTIGGLWLGKKRDLAKRNLCCKWSPSIYL